MSSCAAIDGLLDWHTWTPDKLRLQATDEPAVKNVLIDKHTRAYDQFDKLFKAVSELAEDPGMERTVRELAIPTAVQFRARGKSNTISIEQKKQNANKYLFGLNALTESARLTASAGNYYSPAKLVTLLAPPLLDLIVADKEEPAYLYYRYLKDASLLKGQRQMLRGVSVSKGGTESTINLGGRRERGDSATADGELRRASASRNRTRPRGPCWRDCPRWCC